MGLLDGLLGEVMNGMQGRMPGTQQGNAGSALGGSAIMMIVLQLLQQNGGIGGLLARMQQAGYGGQAQSWVGTGQNQPIPPDALSQIFGGPARPDRAAARHVARGSREQRRAGVARRRRSDDAARQRSAGGQRHRRASARDAAGEEPVARTSDLPGNPRRATRSAGFALA